LKRLVSRGAASLVADAAAARLERYRRPVVATGVLLLAGFGVTAFGIAPLAPDAAELPKRLVQQTIEPEDLSRQIGELAAQPLVLYRSDVTRGTDTPESLLARLGVVDADAAKFLRRDAAAKKLVAGRGGKLVRARAADDGSLIELVARYPAERGDAAREIFHRLTVLRIEGRLHAQVEQVPYTAQPRMASGTIRSTLFAATDEARVPDAVASQLAEVFGTEVDFHRQLKKGDTFSVVYQSLFADGEPVPWNEGAGRLLAAEFVNAGRVHQAVWFEPGAGVAGGYFFPDGKSRKRSFLASPVEFSRVTSGFAMRLHPIFQNWRQHRGVDYAAPTGTPVRTVGEGVVSFSGWQNGYGKVVVVDHGNQRDTLYAHLSRLDVVKGQRVAQGQLIGAVGSTGWSTGPHLHFEFRIDGQHQDPLSLAKSADVVPLAPENRAAFVETAGRLQQKLELAETLAGASPRFE
jgi:murein DD-endopeptidase MepM/ murein hydrolase activator NlpD